MTALPHTPGPPPATAFPPDGPRHVAIIMDGNGRWARRRMLPRSLGHREGVKAVRAVVRAAGSIGLQYLTLFGFSTENWGRPRSEINDLMGLLRRYLREDGAELEANNVCLRVIGRRDRIDADLVAQIAEIEARTRGATGLQLTVAFDYGGRDEIAAAARRLAEDVRAGRIAPDAIDAAAFAARLDTGALPDPDLVIRTSGERRLSNFLLWQSAYAEFVHSDVLWPDFGREHLLAAIDEFRSRERRFGGVAVADAATAG